MHPVSVVYLEHDGKVLLVNSQGEGPITPVQGQLDYKEMIRFPTSSEVEKLGIEFETKSSLVVKFGDQLYRVEKGYPKISWPKNWAWKDACIADNGVHPVARDAIYRSIHRVVSKVLVQNSKNEVLMGRVERGHFQGFWTLPGGYLDHNEHPAIGCVRECFEEFGLKITLLDCEPVVTQRVFNDEGVSFISFTYRAHWDGALDDLHLQEEEIAEAAWLPPRQAFEIAVSHFDQEAIKSLF